MFSLIITIISIALVTALALATIYYGGSAFRQGGDAAAAARFINEGQQLSGAAAVYNAAETTPFAAIADLSTAKTDGTKYLASPITGWTLNAGAFEMADVKGAVCAKVNEKAGVTLTSTSTNADVPNYGCIPGATATDAGKVVFKY